MVNLDLDLDYVIVFRSAVIWALYCLYNAYACNVFTYENVHLFVVGCAQIDMD